ncbi:MAG: hypothetical protein JST80_07210 [Bdellovibrionales bacterium]|nr:hypothetical protein [Bdellovibrionales bacterium]
MGYLLFLMGALLGIAQAAHSETLTETEGFVQTYPEFREAVIAAKEVLANQKESFVSNDILLKLFDAAYADPPASLGEQCFYGGWLSVRAAGGCTKPAGSTTAACKSDFTCNPLLFGDGVCVDFSPRVRQTTYSRCEATFQSAPLKTGSKDRYDFLKDVLKDSKKKDDLMGLISAALAVCGTGAQSKTPMCRKLENKVSLIQKKFKITATVKNAASATESTGSTESMSSKTPTRNAGNSKDCNDGCLTKTVKDPLGKDKGNLTTITKSLAVLNADDLAKLKTRHDEIMRQLKQLVPDEKNSYTIASFTFNPPQATKDKVFALSQERLCIELQIFKSENKLDFDLDCSKGSYKFPALYVEAIKDGGGRINKSGTFEKGGKWMSSFPSAPVTMYIESDGKRIPFKTIDEVLVQKKAGPKLKYGDMHTPEGRFTLSAPNVESGYFISTHIGYENWSDRSSMLSEMKSKDRNPASKGGDIVIHGTGGSDGCISIPNTESALIAAWVKGAPKGQSSIEIYPQKMTDENVAKLSASNDQYKDFWNKLKNTYDESQRRIVNGTKTIDKVL